jgi:3-phosphoshikimate 1-carboxyvinyltransferase
VTDLVVHPQAQPLVGSVPVPADKSITHRALLVGALARGESVLEVASAGEDNHSTIAALRALGVPITILGGAEPIATVRIQGVNLYGLHAAEAPIDCGNSGTTMRLLAGLLAGQSFSSTLVGDTSLSRRPMRRIVDPLRARGARIGGRTEPSRSGEFLPPLEIEGLPEGTYLAALELESKIASAQVKSAALLSGLFAHGATLVREPAVSRDHTERMLAAAGVPVRSVGPLVALDPAGWDGAIAPLAMRVPGDLSAAAFLLTAAQIVPESRVTIRSVGVNPTRTGYLEAIRDMGAGIAIEPKGDEGGEPIADIHAWCAPVSAGRLSGELLLRAIDEVPIFCALAARANGKTRIRDAAELRVKESDRIAAIVHVLRAFGVAADETVDGLELEGAAGPLAAAEVDSAGDHRIAMMAAILALVAGGPTKIRNVDSIRTSFPRFLGTLRALGARVEVVAAREGIG